MYTIYHLFVLVTLDFTHIHQDYFTCTGAIISGLLHLHWGNHIRITSLALGQSYDCPSASEVILKDMGKIIWSPKCQVYELTESNELSI